MIGGTMPLTVVTTARRLRRLPRRAVPARTRRSRPRWAGRRPRASARRARASRPSRGSTRRRGRGGPPARRRRTIHLGRRAAGGGAAPSPRGGPAAGARALLDGHEPVRPRDRCEDRLDVERTQRAQVDDLGVDAVLGELLGGDERVGGALAGGDDRDVVAVARDVRPPERDDDVVAVRGRPLHRVEPLVLEEDDRVVVADRRLKQPLRLGRRRWEHDLQAGDPLEPRRVDLRVDRAEPAAGADRRADDEGHRALLVADVPELRGLVDERVHRQRHEVPEHDLEHGPQPGDRRAVGGAGERQLGDRRVEDAVGAEALLQAARYGEHAPGQRDVLAEEDHALVALELLGERVADRVAELQALAHAANSVARSSRGSGYGAAFALATALSICSAMRRSTSAISDSSTPSASRRSRARGSGSRASQCSTSAFGRYFAGSALEWP